MSNLSESSNKRPSSLSLSGGFQSLRRAVSSRGKKSEKETGNRGDGLATSNPFADPPPPYMDEGLDQNAQHPSGKNAPPRAQSIYNRLHNSSSNDASEDDKFRFLSEFDTAFLIDDSSSMSWNSIGRSNLRAGELSRWEQTRNVIEQIVPMCMRYDQDGVDVYFLNDPYHYAFSDSHRGEPCWSKAGDKKKGKASFSYIGVRNANDVRSVFNSRAPMLATPTGKRLGEILETYVDHYEARVTRGKMPPKPLNIIVITDGEAGDKDFLRDVLIQQAERLDALSAPYHQLGVQFFQVGEDESAARHLRELDDGLGKYRQGKELRDIVDCVTHEQLSNSDGCSQFTADIILKVVLGSVNKHLDSQRVREGFLIGST